MTFYCRFYRNFLFPIFDRIVKRRHTTRYWRLAEESQWWSNAALQSKQLQDLKSIVGYAYEHCDYYRRTWTEHGLKLEQLQSLEDFYRWPVLTREHVRENRLGLQSSTIKKRLTKTTGGSTGEPLEFDLDPDSNQRRTAMTFRGYDWAGGGPGNRRLLIWGADLRPAAPWRRWKRALHHWVDNEKVLNCFDFSYETMGRHFQSMQRFRPQVLIAYTNPLYEFARYLREKSLVPTGIRSIIVGAEKLHDFQRTLIQEVFHAPVFETYGSREFMLIAAECEHHMGMHLSTENVLVQVADDDGQPTPDGQEGNVIVTDLFNRAMPFIRYLSGDRAIAGFTQCSCGRGLPLLKQIVGRRLDVIKTPNGRVVPGEFFPHFFKDYKAIRRFQVRQERLHEIEIHLMVDSPLMDQTRWEIQQQLQQALGVELKIQLQEVESIPLTKSGKLQVVVNCLVDNQRQS
jgi:phenylacetate-CoA ligase